MACALQEFIFSPGPRIFLQMVAGFPKKLPNSLQRNVGNTLGNNEITTHSNQIPLMTTGSRKISFFPYPVLEKRSKKIAGNECTQGVGTEYILGIGGVKSGATNGIDIPVFDTRKK